jgi:hypothetical protein
MCAEEWIGNEARMEKRLMHSTGHLRRDTGNQERPDFGWAWARFVLRYTPGGIVFFC